MFRLSFLFLMGALATGMFSTHARGSVNVQLSIMVDVPHLITPDASEGQNFTPFIGGTWRVYAQLTGDISETSGLGGLQIDVLGLGGMSIYDHDQGDGSIGTTFDLPGNLQGSLLVGFTLQASNGYDGQAIAGYQDTTSYKLGTRSATGYTSILQGVGISAGVVGNNAWAYPALVADGYYRWTASAIGLEVEGAADNMTLLPATLPDPTSGGVGFQVFSPDTVNGVAAPDVGTSETLWLIPEPASAGMLALGVLALLTRRSMR